MTKGIGKAAARLFAANGAKVAISDIDAIKSNELINELKEAGHEAMSIPGDLLDTAFPKRLVDEVLKTWGKVNCLVNNAGTRNRHQPSIPRVPILTCGCPGFCFDSALHKMDEAKFDIVMKMHNYVPFRTIQALAEHWMDPSNKDSPKSIINISSTSGLHGAMGQINYSTAKAGVNGMTKTVAAEWGR